MNGLQQLLEIHGFGEICKSTSAKRLAAGIVGWIGCHHDHGYFRPALLYFTEKGESTHRPHSYIK